MAFRPRQRRASAARPAPPDVDITHASQRQPAAARRTPPDVDARIAAIAERQDGLVTRRQLLALPLSPGAIDGRVRSGRLHVRHRGVYSVGHNVLSPRGRRRAALLATGNDGALSHRMSTYLWRLRETEPAAIDVLVLRNPPRSRDGIVVHGTRRPFTPVVLDGLPVTPPLRTLEDLATIAEPGEVEHACAEALLRRLVTQEELDAAGLSDPDLPPAPSVFARRFQKVLRGSGLPLPVVEHPIGRYRADFAWPAHRVIVETDGWDAHGRRRARFETDRARDSYLMARGWVVVRVTWRRLKREPIAVMVELGQILALRSTS